MIEFQQPLNCIANIVNNLHDYKEAMLISHNTVDFRKTQVRVKWSPPVDGVFKLNTDGSKIKNVIAGCGGVIRDVRGKRMLGFAKFIGKTSVLMEEL